MKVTLKLIKSSKIKEVNFLTFDINIKKKIKISIFSKMVCIHYNFNCLQKSILNIKVLLLTLFNNGNKWSILDQNGLFLVLCRVVSNHGIKCKIKWTTSSWSEVIWSLNSSIIQFKNANHNSISTKYNCSLAKVNLPTFIYSSITLDSFNLKLDIKNYFINNLSNKSKKFNPLAYEFIRSSYKVNANKLINSVVNQPISVDINSHFGFCLLHLQPSNYSRWLDLDKILNIQGFIGYLEIQITNTRKVISTIEAQFLSKIGVQFVIIRALQFKISPKFYAKVINLYSKRFLVFYTNFLQLHIKHQLVLIYGTTGLKLYKNLMGKHQNVAVAQTIVTIANLYTLQFTYPENSVMQKDIDSVITSSVINNVFIHNSIGALKNTTLLTFQTLLSVVFSTKIYFLVYYNISLNLIITKQVVRGYSIPILLPKTLYNSIQTNAFFIKNLGNKSCKDISGLKYTIIWNFSFNNTKAFKSLKHKFYE